MAEIKDFSFEDLKYNFYQRSYNFDLYRAKLSKTNPRLLYWIGSIDYDGYVREKSLKYLIDYYQPGDENRILLRLEDWVKEIRKLAAEWTKNNFGQLSIEQINENYRLILYLVIKQRWYIHSVIRVIEDCLINKLKQIKFKDFNSLNSNFRKYLYNLALPDNHNIRQFLVQDKNPINRLLLLKWFKYHELTLVEKTALQEDKCALIKKKFIYYRLKHNIQPEKSELTRLILDKNKSVRELAGFYLKKYYSIDSYELYKKRSDRLFYYIADFTKKEDTNYFLAGMQLTDKHIKLLCFKALCNIEPELVKQFDLRKLVLENNKFRQLIKKHVLPILSLAELQEFRSILFIQPQGKLIYLNLLYKRSYWDFVEQALDLIIDCPAVEIINLIEKLLGNNIHVYQTVSDIKKEVLVAKINQAEALEENRLYDLCQKIKLVIKNA